jgi:hypothetical protein
MQLISITRDRGPQIRCCKKELNQIIWQQLAQRQAK